jgi:hypothetical protein
MIKKQCKYCEKEIEGYNENHVEHLMKQHLLSKHSDKFEVSKK